MPLGGQPGHELPSRESEGARAWSTAQESRQLQRVPTWAYRAAIIPKRNQIRVATGDRCAAAQPQARRLEGQWAPAARTADIVQQLSNMVLSAAPEATTRLFGVKGRSLASCQACAALRHEQRGSILQASHNQNQTHHQVPDPPSGFQRPTIRFPETHHQVSRDPALASQRPSTSFPGSRKHHHHQAAREPNTGSRATADAGGGLQPGSPESSRRSDRGGCAEQASTRTTDVVRGRVWTRQAAA